MKIPSSLKTVRIDGLFRGSSLYAAYLSWLGGRLGFQVTGNLDHPAPDVPQPPIILGEKSLLLLRNMGLDERDLIKACAGTFAIGAKIQHENMSSPRFYPYVSMVAAEDGVAFHQLYSSIPAEKKVTSYAHYFAPFYMAETASFTHPQGGANYRYGVICDSRLFDDYMRRAAIHYGFKHSNSEDAPLTLLSSQTMPAERWNCKGQADHSMPSHVHYRIKDGALTQIAHTQIEKIETEFAHISTNCTTDFDGTEIWKDDIIDLSYISSKLLPCDHTYFDAISFMLQTLFEVWPASTETSLNQSEFNRRVNSYVSRAMDYQSALLLASGIGKLENTSLALQTKLEQFLSRGRFVSYDDEPVSDAEWIAFFIALGVKSERVDPLTKTISDIKITERLKTEKIMAEKWARTQTSQIDYLKNADALFRSNKAVT